MKLGLESYSVRNSGLDPVGVVRLANELGLQGVLFDMSPFTSFRDEELATIRKTADDLGLYIEFGMGSLFHWHPMAEKGRELLADAGYNVDVSEAEIVIHHLDIARKLGSPLLRCVGVTWPVRDGGQDMVALADGAVAILREACRAAEDMGLKIAMENHADFTARELVGILARVGSPAFGFTVDCGNLAFDLDDPLRLAEIMAPYALTTHYKNYRVLRTPQGIAMGNCALGDGEIDIVGIAEILGRHNPQITINIEIHPQYGPFRLDLFDKLFFTRHAPPPGDGLVWYLERAWAKEILKTLPASLPDGKPAWDVEYELLKQSVRWAKEKLAHLLSNKK